MNSKFTGKKERKMQEFDIIASHDVYHCDGWGYELKFVDEGTDEPKSFVGLKYFDENNPEGKREYFDFSSVWVEAIPSIVESLLYMLSSTNAKIPEEQADKIHQHVRNSTGWLTKAGN
jgi:hypothetical protein